MREPQHNYVALITPSEATYGGVTYGHVDLTFREVDPLRNADDQYCLDSLREGWPNETPYLARLEIHCQFDNDTALADRRVYAQGVRYSNAQVSSSETATAMAATLKRIERFLRKKLDKEGAPLSYGQFAVRVCQALGVDTMAVTNSVDQRFTSGSYYRTMSLGDGRALIDKEIKTFFDKHAAQQKTAA